ncbi:MAG: (2Fe-2S)-binding protein [Desulfamplus sp.]|nr:(2Fe-2S)-binding protein [Desulfamplus sp.]
MVEITVDDRVITAKKGKSVLQAARDNGIRIPHICYHPALKPSGSCRLCVVEIASRSGRAVVMPSCAVKVKSGLWVKTSTQQVLASRLNAFDRLLRMAPDSIRIRRMAEEFNVDIPGLPDGCIRCRLCIRVCRDIIGAKALKMESLDSNGGDVVPEPGRCLGCGTCANICPTGFIRVDDHDGFRTVSLRGKTVGKLPLVRCEGCGRMYVTSDFLNHVETATLDHPHVKVSHKFCKTCVKLLSDKTQSARVTTR